MPSYETAYQVDSQSFSQDPFYCYAITFINCIIVTIYVYCNHFAPVLMTIWAVVNIFTERTFLRQLTILIETKSFGSFVPSCNNCAYP